MPGPGQGRKADAAARKPRGKSAAFSSSCGFSVLSLRSRARVHFRERSVLGGTRATLGSHLRISSSDRLINRRWTPADGPFHLKTSDLSKIEHRERCNAPMQRLFDRKDTTRTTTRGMLPFFIVVSSGTDARDTQFLAMSGITLIHERS